VPHQHHPLRLRRPQRRERRARARGRGPLQLQLVHARAADTAPQGTPACGRRRRRLRCWHEEEHCGIFFFFVPDTVAF
jgi:hypothetical protein